MGTPQGLRKSTAGDSNIVPLENATTTGSDKGSDPTGPSASFRLAHAANIRSLVWVTASLTGLAALYLAYCLATVPFNGGLAIAPTPSALLMETGDGALFAARGVYKGEKLTAAELPNLASKAVVAIEDRRFYEHGALDLRGIARALWRNVTQGRLEGASTITQQLARLTYLSPEQTIRRKIQEAVLAIWLEHHLGKDEILTRYLNTAYFGAGAYGIDAAARRYFGKRARDLSLTEAAMLAGLVRAPSALAPDRNPDGARQRAELVLDAMAETGAITADEARAAREKPVTLSVPPDTPDGSNYFVDHAGAEAKAQVGAAAGDLRVRTTLDPHLQEIAERAVKKHLAAEGRTKHVGQAAVLALAHDGAILAMVGGRDYRDSQFNRVTQARRQPGSLFKLFVYLAALEKGLTPDSVVVDRPVQIGTWEPENYGGRYRGAMSARSAFANSVNTVAVQLADEVGIPAIIDVARRLGVRSDLPAVPSLALGTAEVTLFEMTRAFAAVASGTEAVDPYAVRSIRKDEQILFTRPAAASKPASNREARAEMLDLLAGVVREGTGKAARLPVPSAGKTGTSQNYRDAWFVGFTPDIVVGVWVGNDDNRPMNRVTGGSLPAAIWRDIVSQTLSLPRRPGPLVQARAAPETVGRSKPDAPAPGAGTVRGAPRVLDTGTIEIGGQVLRLAGVDGVGGRFAHVLGRILRRREVVCEPAGATHRCRIGPIDLSELIVANGGGRASADAGPDLEAAEEAARQARRGLWR